ncbi:MAG: tetratricopeptide repeat protein [Candidatus Competibacteraceae bacterium]
MNRIEQLENLLAKGQDNALLRFGLGTACLQAGESARAVEHLRVAVRHDPAYSAAWKALGKALTETGQIEAAGEAYEAGIRAAEAKGDVQAAKEMKVFLNRLHKR